MNLIENHYEGKKIIITTHHIGLATILSDWLSKGEKANKFKATRRGENNKYKISILEKMETNTSCPAQEIVFYSII